MNDFINQSGLFATEPFPSKINFDLFQGESNIYDLDFKNFYDSSKYNKLNFLPKVIFEFFIDRICLFPIIIIILSFSNEELSVYENWFLILPLCFSFFLFSISEYLFDKNHINFDNKINNQTVQKISRLPPHSELIKFSNLKISDVIYLKKGDIAPSHLIILDTNEINNKEAICLINTKKINGKKDLEIKKACIATQIVKRNVQKNNFAEYKKLLTGSVEYKTDIEKFEGYIKLKKDPKKGVLSNENLILRGSIIQSGWIIGMVIAFSNSPKIECLTKRRRINFEKKFLIIQLFTIIILIFISLLSHIILFAIHDNYQFLMEIDPKLFTSLKFLYFIVFYHTIVPFSFYIVWDISFIIFYLKNLNNDDLINYNNPKILSNLPEISHAFLDKTGTLTSSKFIMSYLLVNNKIYNIESDYKKPKIEDNNHNSLIFKNDPDKEINHEKITNDLNKKLGTTEEMATFIDLKNGELITTNQQFSLQTIPFSSTVFSDLSTDLSNPFIKEFLKGMSFCHNSKVIYDGPEKKHFFSISKEDELFLNFSKKFGYSFEGMDNLESHKEYHYIVEGEKEKLKILAINEYSQFHKRFSILLENTNNQKVTVYCKGDLENMKDILKISKEDYEMIYEWFKENGLKSSIITQKSITIDEANEYNNSSMKIKSGFFKQEGDFLNLYNKLESNLEIIGIVGYKEKIKKETPSFISFLKQIDSTIWILTGDSYSNTISTSHECGLISSSKEIWELMTETNDQLISGIRKILNEIQLGCFTEKERRFSNELQGEKKKIEDLSNIQTLKEKNKLKTLVFTGKSLKLIVKDEYLLSHFALICSLVGKIIGVNLDSDDKAQCVKLVKERFPRNIKCMAVGDGYNDIPMFDQSDISFEICKKHKNKLLNNSYHGDIQITNLSHIEKLFNISTSLYLNNINLMYYVIYITSIIGFILFFFNTNNKLFNDLIIENLFIFLMEYIIPIIIIILFDYKVLTTIQAIIVSFEIKRISIKRIEFKILGIIFMSIVHSIVTIAWIFDGINLFGVEEKHIDLGTYTTMFQIQIFLLIFIRILPKLDLYKLKSWLIIIFMWIVFILFISLRDNENKYRYQIENIFYSLSSPFLILFITFFCYVLSFILESLISRKINLTSIEILANSLSINVDLINEYKKIKKETEKFSFGGHIKKIFKTELNMDKIVTEMIKPSDTMLFDLRISPYTLKILNSSLESKYKIEKRINLSRNFRFYYLLLLITYGVFCLLKGLTVEDPTIYVITFFAFLILGFFVFSKILKSFYYSFIMWLYIVILIYIIYIVVTSKDIELIYCVPLFSLITTVNFNINVLYILILNIVLEIILFIRLGVFYESLDLENFYKLFILSLMIITVFVSNSLNFIMFFEDEKLRRNEFIAEQTLEMQSSSKQDILSILVPRFVMDYIEQGREMNEKQSDVVIIFCDIYDFDKIIESKGKKIVEILDELFRKFDIICNSKGIQKIETVGKTYMACAGIKACENEVSSQILLIEKCKRVLDAAFEMMADSNDLILKIGIHKGKVIAGIIGYHKPQFSLIGDTVNTTSRICSTSDKGIITISAEVHEKVKFSEYFFKKKMIEAKGKGVLETYQVSKEATGTIFKTKISNAIQKLKIKKTIGLKGIEKNMDKMSASSIVAKVFKRKQALPYKIDNFGVKSNPIEISEINPSPLRIELMKKIVGNYDSDVIVEQSNVHNQLKDLRHHCLFKLSVKYDLSEKEFYEDVKIKKQRMFGIIFIIFLMFYFFHTFLIFNIEIHMDFYDLVIGLRNLVFLLLLIIFIVKNRIYNSYSKRSVYLLLAVLMIAVTILEGLLYHENINFMNKVLILELTLIFTFLSYNPTFFMIFPLLTFLLLIIGFFLILSKNYFINYNNIFYFFTYCGIQLIKMYSHKRMLLISYNNTNKRIVNTNEQENIISQLLPMHSLQKLKDMSGTFKTSLTDEFDDVTLLFADIAGFTKYSGSVSAEEVLSMLRSLFTEFDKTCLEFDVYKVYTIGDCYVVMSFTNSSNRNPLQEAKNVISMSLVMLEIIQKVKNEINFHDLNMRIGVHTGSIIGGIIGTDVVRFDIYGKDVLLANKMESSGSEGNINVSEKTKKLLEKDANLGFGFKYHGEVICKGFEEPVKSYLIIKDE